MAGLAFAAFCGFPPRLPLCVEPCCARQQAVRHSLLPSRSVDTLVMLGSPLGCFLALRGVAVDGGAGLGSAASGPLMQVRGWDRRRTASRHSRRCRVLDAAGCRGFVAEDRITPCRELMKGVATSSSSRTDAPPHPTPSPTTQLAPGQRYSSDGLPAVRRLYNVYHPYDPVAHRWPACLPACLLAGRERRRRCCQGAGVGGGRRCAPACCSEGGPSLTVVLQPAAAASLAMCQPPMHSWPRPSAPNRPRPALPCRVEPLAQPLSEVQRAPFVPLFKGGKRIHLAVQARHPAALLPCCHARV